jgi:hypothetical protein
MSDRVHMIGALLAFFQWRSQELSSENDTLQLSLCALLTACHITDSSRLIYRHDGFYPDPARYAQWK